MTATQSLNLYNLSLKYFKNDADAAAFVKEIEVVVDNKFDNKKDILATKEDIANVKLEIKEQKAELLKWMFVMFLPFYIGMIVFLMKVFL